MQLQPSESANLSQEPTFTDEISESDDEREEDDLDDCDLVSSEDSGSDDSSDEDDDDDDGPKPRKPDLFPDPLSLIDHTADLNSVLKAKSIGDAIQILCPNLPGKVGFTRSGFGIVVIYLLTLLLRCIKHVGLPSKARGKYQKRKLLTEEQKAKILRARNRDNARRTRKRKKLYVNFIDKALRALENALGISAHPSSSTPTKIEDDSKSDVGRDGSDRTLCCIIVPGVNCGSTCTTTSSTSATCALNQASVLECESRLKENKCQQGATTITGEFKTTKDLPSLQKSSLSEEERFCEVINNQTENGSDRNQNEMPCETMTTKKNLISKRLRYMRAYMKLRHNPLANRQDVSGEETSSKLAEWLTVCAAEVVHATPLAAFRRPKDLQQMCSCPPNCIYECRGVDAVEMDSLRLEEYFDRLVSEASNTPIKKNATDRKFGDGMSHAQFNHNQLQSIRMKQRGWTASIVVDSESATLCDNGRTLNVTYSLTVQQNDKIAATFKPSVSSNGIIHEVSPRPVNINSSIPLSSYAADISREHHLPLHLRIPRHPTHAVMDNSCTGKYTAKSRSETTSEPDCSDNELEDDIGDWLAMALNSTYTQDPSYRRYRDADAIRGPVAPAPQVATIPFHTDSNTSEWTESDSDVSDYHSCQRRRAKRRRNNSGDDEDAGTAVLFRQRIMASVEFGGSGCDSDGRILRISERFIA